MRPSSALRVSTADAIVQSASLLLDDEQAYNAMSRAVNPYGDGLASKRIAEKLKS